ncbi:MAG: 30S ribosome-binding factor RbfA, partial [Coriobacteriia bacterium]
MKQTPATRRLNEQAREVVASLLVSEISDPRIELVTVTGAEVSPDRSVLLVFVSAGPDRYDEVLEGLESAKGRIRSLLGRALGWRVTPELRFYIDKSVDSGMRIEEALLQVPPSLAAERAAEAAGEGDSDVV